MSVFDGRALPRLARAIIAHDLGAGPEPAEPAHTRWAEPGAVFVTLRRRRDQALRGCIGSVEAHRALWDDLRDNARAAAFRDPRFRPVTADELPGLAVEVSLLSRPRPMEARTPEEFVREVRPRTDGVVLTCGSRRGVFLPQVWEKLPNPGEFLAALVRKAGLPPGTWNDDIRLQRFTVNEYREEADGHADSV